MKNKDIIPLEGNGADSVDSIPNNEAFEDDEQEKIYCICCKEFMIKKDIKKFQCPFCKNVYVEGRD